MVLEVKEEQSPLYADCLIVRSKKEACEDKTDQSTDSPPVEKSAQRNEHYVYNVLNIRIFDNYFIDQHQSVTCVNMSVEKHVQLKCCLDFLQTDLQSVVSSESFWPAFLLSVFAVCLHCIRCAAQKGLEAGFSILLQVMFSTLTPRHLLSLIWHLMGCCCEAKASFLLFILFGSLISQSHAGSLVTTNQKLPRECYAFFTSEHEDCPVKADWDPYWDDRWGKLNHTCCSDFPGTVLHCQRQGTRNFPACLQEQTVDKGHTGLLMKDDDENPQFKTIPCNSNMTYNSDQTLSSNVTFPYCLRLKSKCKRVGEELHCLGGTVTDNLCACSTGFRPVGKGCHNGFTDEDDCECVAFTCAAGEYPVLRLHQIDFCVNLTKDGVLQFGCENFSTPTLPPAEADQNRSSVSMPSRSENTFRPVSPSVRNVTGESTFVPRPREIHDDTDIVYDVVAWFVFGLMIFFLGFLFGSAYIANMEDDEHPSLPFCRGRSVMG